MKSYILQPNHVRGLGNILDNEDNIEGLYCRVQQQNTTVDFEEVIMKTYYMGTGSELTITFITDSFSILPNSTAHIDVMVTDEEDNPVVAKANNALTDNDSRYLCPVSAPQLVVLA